MLYRTHTSNSIGGRLIASRHARESFAWFQITDSCDGIAFDGFRKQPVNDFTSVFHFDFKGNARTTAERRRQEGGNIFHDQIRCGVGITILVRRHGGSPAAVYYHAVNDYWKAERKAEYLASFHDRSQVAWKGLVPDSEGNWLVLSNADDGFKVFVP